VQEVSKSTKNTRECRGNYNLRNTEILPNNFELIYEMMRNEYLDNRVKIVRKLFIDFYRFHYIYAF